MSKKRPQNKAKVLKELKTIPVVSVACSRVGVGRATYYRWLREDKGFEEDADKAIDQGTLLINDMAESRIINDIKEGKPYATLFWLRHNHKTYFSPTLKAYLGKRKDKHPKLVRALVKFVGGDPKFRKK